MRHGEVRLFDDLIAVHDQIEVERTRRARVRALTTEGLLDLEKPGEQGAGRKRRAARRGGVQKARLGIHPDRVGVVEGRYTQIIDGGRERGQRLAQVALPIAKIAPKRDGNVDQSLTLAF